MVFCLYCSNYYQGRMDLHNILTQNALGNHGKNKYRIYIYYIPKDVFVCSKHRHVHNYNIYNIFWEGNEVWADNEV